MLTWCSSRERLPPGWLPCEAHRAESRVVGPDSSEAFDMLGVLPKAATSKRPARHARQRPLIVAELSSARERLEGVYGESDEIISCLASWRKEPADRQV